MLPIVGFEGFEIVLLILIPLPCIKVSTIISRIGKEMQFVLDYPGTVLLEAERLNLIFHFADLSFLCLCRAHIISINIYAERKNLEIGKEICWLLTKL